LAGTKVRRRLGGRRGPAEGPGEHRDRRRRGEERLKRPCGVRPPGEPPYALWSSICTPGGYAICIGDDGIIEIAGPTRCSISVQYLNTYGRTKSRGRGA
jgi:hypothetical protein